MSEQETRPTVAEMLRTTGENTKAFMEQVALHLEKLEAELVRLTERVAELESKNESI